MKVFLQINLLLIALILSSCYNQRPEITCKTYNEPKDPEAKNLEEWEATGRGLHLSFGEKDIKYKKSKVPMLGVTKDKEVLAWKGETVSFQAVLWSAFPVSQIECEWENLIASNGDTIPNSVIQTRYVRYVLSDTNFVNEESDQISWRDSCLLPDMLDSLPCMDMMAQSVRPVWVKIHVPEDVKAGVYSTSLKVYSRKNPPQELRLKLKVCDKVLPRPENWRFQTNMYINPVAIAQWHKVDVWSEKHYEAMLPYVDLMKRAGQKAINVSIFPQANSANENHALITWKKSANNRLQADFTKFDQWIKFMMNHGISSQLDCYILNPELVSEVIYTDETKQTTIREQLDVNKNKALIKQCLKQVVDHLKEKDWYGKAVFAIGKGSADDVSKLKDLLQNIESGIRLELVAHEWTSGLLKDVYAANVPSGFSNLKEWFKLRHQQGLETSYQLDDKVAFPNTYLHSPSSEAAWFGWYVAAQGLDGLHIDNFNNWGQYPLTDARLSKSSSGSNFLIYPGGRSSIRYEQLLEGIQDYEKIVILKEELVSNESASNTQKLELIDEVLSDFVIDRIPRESASQMVKSGKDLIEELSMN
ncbi:MAG: DUF4091 domain-containing protein [Carboxylicivirga sp.]|nr:DUF4091 domain-containing protein [Carboxylicivirga sp.]